MAKIPQHVLKSATADANRYRLIQAVWHTTDPDARWVWADSTRQDDAAPVIAEFKRTRIVEIVPDCWWS